MPELDIALRVNGRAVKWRIEPGDTLLEALHAHYLRGTADDRELLTIEGLAEDGKLHPIQEAFAEEGAAQCGFCTPGFIMRAYAFLREQPRPTEAEVRAALAGNICRCTGYVKPVAAVLRAAEMMQVEQEKGPHE